MATHSTARPAHTGRNPLLRLIAGLSTLCGWMAALMILGSVFITCQMIFVRFVLEKSTIWQTEAVIYLMIAATLLGLPYVQKLRGHVNVDLIPGLLPAGARRVLLGLTFLLSMAVIGVMGWYSYDLWHLSWQRGWTSDTVWGVKLWIPYLAMPVGFGLYVLQLGADLAAEIAPAETAEAPAKADGEAR